MDNMRDRLLAGNRLWLAILTLSIVGCTTPKNSKGSKSNSKMSDAQQQKLDEYKAEIEIGRNMSGRLLAYYGVHNDDVLLGYVNQVGSYVASYSDTPERRFMFQILDTDAINAFACPGGYILLTRGSIEHAKNEAELAHVLGHEVVHVGKKHMFDALKGMSKDEMEKAAQEADKAALSFSDELKARKRPVVKEDSGGALLAKYLSGSAAGLSILSAARAGMSLILEKGLGAEKEFEADAFGTKFAVNAGYHPKALMNYLCRIEQKKLGLKGPCRLPKKAVTKKKKSILDKTHPPVADRVANIKSTLVSMSALENPGARGTGRYVKYKKRLPKK